MGRREEKGEEEVREVRLGLNEGSMEEREQEGWSKRELSVWNGGRLSKNAV